MFAVSAAPALADETLADVLLTRSDGLDGNLFDHDVLTLAMRETGLMGQLADDEIELTVFAPNDMAFLRLARDLGFEGLGETNAWEYLVTALGEVDGRSAKAVLSDILLYHVVSERVTPFDFSRRSLFDEPLRTEQGGRIHLRFMRLVDNDPERRDAYLVFPGTIRASNGVARTVSRVLLPLDMP